MHPGAIVGPYRVLRHLGSGGMGAVWLAEDTRLHRQVALKMVRPDDSIDDVSRARLMREARAAAALNHPHIATVHDVLEDEGQVIIVFEYVEGETLYDRITRGPIPAPEAVDIATQITRALVHAHAHGIVHRDLKPLNVILGAGAHVKVLDFGVARILSSSTAQTSGGGGVASTSNSSLGLIGTAGYAAPEQMVSGAVDPRADLYALGVVLFEMISGRRPFIGDDVVKLASAKLTKDAPPLSSTSRLIPAALDQLVATLLARDPDGRPASAMDALSALRAIYGTPSTGSLVSRRPGRATAIAAAVIAVVVLGVFGLREVRRLMTPAEDGSEPQVIAVMPFTNLSGDPSKDFVAAGIAESLIASLAALPAITVLSRSAVAEARSSVKDDGALAEDLGATYLVNGSVQQSGGTLKVSVNLVRPDRTVAWGDSVEGQFAEIFELHSRLVATLTNALVTRVSASERQQLGAQPTSNPEALSAYWRGQALLERKDVRGNIDASIAAFGEAITIDPKFALAHAALGAAYWRNYVETKAPEWAERAVDAGTTALRIDPNQPEVRYVMALTLAGRGRAAEAIDELSRALQMRPNYDDARRELGQVLAEKGDIDAAIVEFRRAISLRPSAPGGYSTMGFALLSAARYKDAAEAFEQLVRLAPDNAAGYQQLGAAYQFLGDNVRALDNYRKALAIRPSAAAYSNMGALLHLQGDFAGAVDSYRRAIAIRPNSATTHRNLGDAFLRLNQAAEARQAFLEAVRLGEADLKVNSTDVRNLSALAVYYQKVGNAPRASALITDALGRAPDNAVVRHRASLIHILAGRRAESLAELKRAIDLGYSKSELLDDDEFLSIRKLPEFQDLVNPPVKE